MAFGRPQTENDGESIVGYRANRGNDYGKQGIFIRNGVFRCSVM